MAKCNVCDQEMTNRVGCDPDHLTNFGALTWEGDNPCHDCSCPPGTLHHPGCDAERCPSCHGQRISCDCEMND